MMQKKNDGTPDVAPSADTTTVAPAALAPTRVSDGFDSVDDDGGRSQISGTLVKYDDEWFDTAGQVVIVPTREFLIVEIVRSNRKWTPDNKLADFRVLAPDERFPDIEKLNAEAPPEEWRDSFGQRKGPWENAFYVYFLDPKTLEGFTWPTATAGGFRCVSELKGAVRRARMLQGDNIFPLVTLSSAAMKTRFGPRQRPAFKVVRFVPIGGQAKPLLEPVKPKPPLREELNDEIPW